MPCMAVQITSKRQWRNQSCFGSVYFFVRLLNSFGRVPVLNLVHVVTEKPYGPNNRTVGSAMRRSDFSNWVLTPAGSAILIVRQNAGRVHFILYTHIPMWIGISTKVLYWPPRWRGHTRPVRYVGKHVDLLLTKQNALGFRYGWYQLCLRDIL